jgi:thiosulfate/3-mercaptopyruvate sulfurtransferase
VGRDDVRAHLDDASRVLIDMRTDEEYSGERVSPHTSPFDHGAERSGRIPGARHLYFEELLGADGRFLAPKEIVALLESAGASEDADVVTYCRLSHRATLGWFAATRIAGWQNVRVYDGSWTEWGSIVGFPIEH